MEVDLQDNFSKRSSYNPFYIFVKNLGAFFLMLSVLFFFNSVMRAEEKQTGEIKVIREGPPPLEEPQYLDLGTFVVNMPGDKYFLKS